MKTLLILFMSLFFFSTTFTQDIKRPVSMKVINVELIKGYRINWDTEGDTIIRDKLYLNLTAIKVRKKDELIKAIANKVILADSVCTKEAPLRIGDIAFIFIDNEFDIPYSSLFQVWFDVIECEYTLGILDYVEEERNVVIEKLKSYDMVNYWKKYRSNEKNNH